MKARLYYYIVNNGDGSASPAFFSSPEKLNKFIKKEEDYPYFEGFCEADGFVDVEIDQDGKISGNYIDSRLNEED